MPDLPKIVRQRLNASRSVSGHPDPDVLSAFSESLLPAPERAMVMEHLARCGDCRDVLALVPPIEETTAAARPIRTVPRPWLTWPVLRWGLVAAGLAIAVSAGLLYQRRSTSMVASRFSLPTPAGKKAESATGTAAKPDAASQKKDLGAQAGRMPSSSTLADEAKLPVPSRQVQAGSHAKISATIAGAGSASAVTVNSKVATAQPSGDAASAPHVMHGLVNEPAALAAGAAKQGDLKLSDQRVPSSSEAVEVQSQAVTVVTANDARNQELDGQNEQAYTRSDKVDKAKPPVTVQGAPPAAPAPLRTAPATQPAQPTFAGYVPAPRWTVSTDGSLQRSLDEGKTWQDVNVNGPPATASDSLQKSVADELVAEQDSPRREKKSMARLVSHPIFRAVAIIGSEVWAGGLSGALYHSVDGGMHWMHVSPSAKGTSLTSDIIRLEFPDSQHGRITTSTSDIWTTADGGHSWQH